MIFHEFRSHASRVIYHDGAGKPPHNNEIQQSNQTYGKSSHEIIYISLMIVERQVSPPSFKTPHPTQAAYHFISSEDSETPAAAMSRLGKRYRYFFPSIVPASCLPSFWPIRAESHSIECGALHVLIERVVAEQ